MHGGFVLLFSVILLTSIILPMGLDLPDGQIWINRAEASGSNRFIVWQDNTSGNDEILLKRSVDSGSTWGVAVNLSTNAGSSYNPEIIVSGANVYVVWTQDNAAGTTSDIFFRKSANDGSTWGPKVKISASGTSIETQPHVRASGTNVYVVWDDDGSNEVYLRRSTDNGATWKTIKNLSADAGDSDLAQLAVSDSKVFLSWQDDTSGNDEIFLRVSTDNGATWKDTLNLSSNPGKSYNPDLLVSGPKVLVSWNQQNSAGTTADIFFRRSLDNGATWGPKVKVSTSRANPFPSHLAASGSNVYIAWHSAGGDIFATDAFIQFARSTDNGATWKPEQTVGEYSCNCQPTSPHIAASGSSVYQLWVEDANLGPGGPITDIHIRRSLDNGATWKPTLDLSNSGDADEPQIAVSGSSVYVVWAENFLHSDVHLRRSTDNAGTWKSVVNLSNNSGESIRPQVGT